MDYLDQITPNQNIISDLSNSYPMYEPYKYLDYCTHNYNLMQSVPQASQHPSLQAEQTQTLNQKVSKYLAQEYKMEDFERLVQALKSQNISDKHLGIIGIYKLLELESFSLGYYYHYGLIQLLISFLKQETYPHLQIKSCQILRKVVSQPRRVRDGKCDTQQLSFLELISVKGIPLMLDLLTSASPQILEQVMLTLGQICSQQLHYSNRGIKKRLVNQLTRFLQKASEQRLITVGCYILSSLCQERPLPKYENVEDALRILVHWIIEQKINDKETENSCLSAIHFNTSSQSRVKPILRLTFLSKLLDNLRQPQLELVLNSARVINNVIRYSNSELLLEDLLPLLEKLLTIGKSYLHHSVCSVISNLALKNRSIHISQNLMNKLCQLLEKQEQLVGSQVCNIIANCTLIYDPYLLLSEHFKHRIFKLLMKTIQSEKQPLVLAGLACLNSLLVLGDKLKDKNENEFFQVIRQMEGFYKMLQKLQYHKNEKVYQLTTTTLVLIDGYYKKLHQLQQF